MPISLAPLYGGGFLVAFLQIVALYYPAAILLHYIVPSILPVKTIQVQPRNPGDVTRDALGSIGPIAVKAGIWTIVEQLHSKGYGLLYTRRIDSIQEVLYILLCIVVLDYLHDGWFYWTHRLLHWRPLYKWVHFEHHRSRAPTAFTGYSFHVAEAALVFANEVLVCFLFPMHMGLHRWYHLMTTVIHEGGHVGYEMAPFIPSVEQLVRVALKGLGGATRALNTVQHHDMHHRFPAHHFSLYFTHWDRWCGTMHPKYDQNLFTYFS